jgi:SPP1 family predicted phage head-tail adaptor
MPLDAGRLSNRINLESDEITRESGVEKKVSTTYATSVPANVMPAHGREQWRGQQIRPEVDWIVELRYRTDVNAQHRVVFGSLSFEILSVIPDTDRREFVTLMCRSFDVG